LAGATVGTVSQKPDQQEVPDFIGWCHCCHGWLGLNELKEFSLPPNWLSVFLSVLTPQTAPTMPTMPQRSKHRGFWCHGLYLV
jgi:hypothetical protein